jgi:hypothetical protein
LNKINSTFISKNRISLIAIPIIIAILSIAGFFLINKFFLLIFFAANMFHVTRQSFGICKLYCKNISEIKFQENFIYLINLLFFSIAFLRFYSQTIAQEFIFLLNIIVFLLLILLFIFYIYKFKFSDNFLTFCTGCLIFYPTCFVSNPVHVIIMGVTMHYTQYLYLTNKVYFARNTDLNIDSIFTFLKSKYFLTIIIYALTMSILSIFGKFDQSVLKHLLIIPIIGQMLHFYLDSQLWKFSEKHNRENILKHIT